VRLSVKVEGDFVEITGSSIAEGKSAVTRGVAAAGAGLQADWRAQIAAAGLGLRLARTIRREVYPQSGTSLRAAALVWSKASEIVDAFDRGALIRSADGFWLAIPLAAAGARGAGGKRITPGGWEQRTGRRLRFVYRRGRPSLLVADDARLNSRGLAASKGGRRRRDGTLTGAQTVPVFLLVPQVKLAKRLDLGKAATAWQNRLAGLILSNWPEGTTR